MEPGCKEFEKNLSQPYFQISKQVSKAVQEGCEATIKMVPK